MPDIANGTEIRLEWESLRHQGQKAKKQTTRLVEASWVVVVAESSCPRFGSS